jgi:hypothetical protein
MATLLEKYTTEKQRSVVGSKLTDDEEFETMAQK